MEINQEKEQKIRQIQHGEYEQEFYLNAKELANFLQKIATQLEQGEEIVISTNNWEIPFQYREPINVEIEFEGDDEEKELEIELEFKGKQGETLQVK